MSLEKQELYLELLQQAEALLEDENNFIANLANVASLTYWKLAETNWVGFYIVEDNELVLGPFQGKPACVRIPLGRGVCGTAARQNQVQLVEDVHQFEGHIACDYASNSEIVLPICKDGEVVAVFDLDSPRLARFDDDDKQGLSKIVDLIESKI